MKIIIAGTRTFNNYEKLKKACNYYFQNQNNIEIVCGLAKGADLLGKKYAEEYGLNIKYFPANWNEYGKSAGYIRNEEMALYADAAIVFWDKKSRGSKSMIDLSMKHNLKLRIVYV